jgi:hypothetical protein
LYTGYTVYTAVSRNKTVRVSETTHARLSEYRQKGEPFGDAIARALDVAEDDVDDLDDRTHGSDDQGTEDDAEVVPA